MSQRHAWYITARLVIPHKKGTILHASIITAECKVWYFKGNSDKVLTISVQLQMPPPSLLMSSAWKDMQIDKHINTTSDDYPSIILHIYLSYSFAQKPCYIAKTRQQDLVLFHLSSLLTAIICTLWQFCQLHITVMDSVGNLLILRNFCS